MTPTNGTPGKAPEDNTWSGYWQRMKQKRKGVTIGEVLGVGFMLTILAAFAAVVVALWRWAIR